MNLEDKRNEILKMAREVAEKEGWTWLEPIKIELQNDVWILETNYLNRGLNIRMGISHSTGEIKFKGFLKR